MPPPRNRRPADRDDDDFDDRPLCRRSNEADSGSNTKWIIIGVAAFLVVGGVIAFIATRGKTDKPGDPPTQIVDNKEKSKEPLKTGSDQAKKTDRSKDKTPKKETIKKDPPNDLMVTIGKMVNGWTTERAGVRRDRQDGCRCQTSRLANRDGASDQLWCATILHQEVLDDRSRRGVR